jgi:hypothetical protein
VARHEEEELDEFVKGVKVHSINKKVTFIFNERNFSVAFEEET